MGKTVLKLKHLGNFEKEITHNLNLHVKINSEWPHICVLKIQFQNCTHSHFMHRVKCSVHIDHGTRYAELEKGIATWTGVEYPLAFAEQY